jgi:hypothetical protein
MHLQVRSSVQTGSGGSLGAERLLEDGVQADPVAVKPGTLRAFLDVLRTAEPPFNLRTAGGRAIETTGEFVFAVTGETEDDDVTETRRARKVLRDAGYRAEIYEVHHDDLADKPGELERLLGELGPDELVHEVFVGTPNADGTIPVQVTTLRVEANQSTAAAR